MARTSPVHYIAPSVISITPNANGLSRDLAVYIANGAKIKVYSLGIKALDMVDATWQEWTLSGRNRRLNANYADRPFTIYARLQKSGEKKGYLVFAAKELVGENWEDKYAYVTMSGLATNTVNKSDSKYWWVKLGEVSEPINGVRTVDLDTGILGTEQFNTSWNLDPDDMPLRVELDCQVEGKNAGDKPYVAWGQELIMRARLVQGWVDTDVARFDHWEIRRNTGATAADNRWNALDRSTGFWRNGNIALSHERGAGDDFNGAFSSTFTIIAYGTADEDDASSSSSSDELSSSSSSSSSGGEALVQLAMATVNVMAETAEKYELELSDSVVNYDPTTDIYNPIEGIKVRIRATDQKGNVFKLTRGQLDNAGIAVQYALTGSELWTTLYYTNASNALAEAAIPVSAFTAQQNVNVRIVKLSSSSSSSSESSEPETEIYRTPIAFVRNGEDTKDREWIYQRSQGPVSYGNAESAHPLPSLIEYGEVDPVADESNPSGAARPVTTERDQDGWVPAGWTDEEQGTTEDYRYEYASHRDWIREGADAGSSSASSDSNEGEGQHGGHWGEFSTPTIWRYLSEDAVTYRCRWTLADIEVYQLKAAYTGAFRGTLPLVATLMKRTGDNPEQQVTAELSYVTVQFDGLPAASQPSEPYEVTNPQFKIGSGENEHPEFVPYLSNVALNAINITFTVNGESHDFNIPVIREADEDSVKDTIDEYGSTRFLSKLYDDTAAGKMTFEKIVSLLQGLKIGNENSRYGISESAVATLSDIIFDRVLKSYGARKGFTDGYGVFIDALEGLIETDGLEVRGFMRVMELVINRLQLMESDYSFTEGGTVEHIDVTANAQQMVFRMHKEHDNDTTPFYPGDILYAKVNDLLSHGSYYTAWVRVVSVDQTENTLTVVPYVGKLSDNTPVVPGSKNFTPLGTEITTEYLTALQADLAAYPDGYDKPMNLTRHGNVADGIDPATGQPSASILASQKGRQQAWVLSTTDKRLSFFWNVDSPIIRDENYALCLGILPDLANLPSTRDRNMPSLYVNTVFFDHSHRANFPATEVKTDRGAWTATPTALYDGSEVSDPYHYRHINQPTWLTYRNSPSWQSLSDEELLAKINQEFKEDLETSRVWRYGILWECLTEGTTEAPGYGCEHWSAISGDTTFALEFSSSRGLSFRIGYVNTVITCFLAYGMEDITAKVAAEYWTWERSSENGTVPQDATWNAQHAHQKTLTLTSEDMPPGWSTANKAIFTCKVQVGTTQVENAIIA